MALFKCKMCGGALEINNNETVVTCEYCGTPQTLPKLDDDRRANRYDRANHFRRNNEFDKAMGIYEQILNDDSSDAEAYWSLVLCRYGIEYVEDPSSHKRIPTVNRAQFTSIFDDDNYKSALQYADSEQRHLYENEAKAINEIQKGILAISQKEEPFDVFICYKETDNNGRRTPDSVLAQELYYQLKQEGFKVFFSRITLEDKLGSAYEPYIFAALNSAKVMVVLGTRPEYFNAVWVKNEWSRYLALIKNGAKKILIPAYRDMDPYNLPDEFSHLQAQDMSKLGFMQDLIRGIKKIARSNEPKATVVKETVVSGGNINIEPLLKRAFMFLEDENWESADEYCEKVLDADPENARAYLGKLMAELKITTQENLTRRVMPFDEYVNYKKTIRFADDELRETLTGYIEFIKTRNENARLKGIYKRAKEAMAAANTESAYREAAEQFETIPDYEDARLLIKECYEKAEIARKDAIYYNAKGKLVINAGIYGYEQAIKCFEQISGWRDADEQIDICKRKIAEITAKAEADRIERERQAEQARLERERKAELARKQEKQRVERNRKIAGIVAAIVCAVIAVVLVINMIIIPNGKYNDAIALMESGKYTEAISAFEALGDYRNSLEKIEECNEAINEGKYNNAIELMNAGDYISAIAVFKSLDGYKDSANKVIECDSAIREEKYKAAVKLMDEGDYIAAIDMFRILYGYKDSEDRISKCNAAITESKYNEAVVLMEKEDYISALAIFKSLGSYKDSENKIIECSEAIKESKYNNAIALAEAGCFDEAYSIFLELGDYKESVEKAYNIQRTVIKEKLQGIKVGDYVTFGKYEQDNNKSNGKEDVEWLVLDVKEGKALVISKCGLDIKPYNTDWTSISWETCTLRKWLNEDFLSSTFTEMEREMIPTVTVSADKNPEYNTDPGNETQDKVFLLSIAEAENYFSADNERVCLLSDYVDALTYGRFKEGGYWWLRSPGGEQSYAADVDKDGFVFSFGSPVYKDNYRVVRPAIWLDFNP